jgi:hypothetical protein
MTTTITELQIKRMPLPTLRISDARDGLLDVFDTYAEVSCGGFNAEVVRYSYWDARDGREEIDCTYEARINGLREDGAGMDHVYSTNPADLRDLATVCGVTALLLDEIRP